MFALLLLEWEEHKKTKAAKLRFFVLDETVKSCQVKLSGFFEITHGGDIEATIHVSDFTGHAAGQIRTQEGATLPTSSWVTLRFIGARSAL